MLTDSEGLESSSLEVSSYTSGNEADKAFDGDNGTMWRCDNRSGVTWDASPNMKIRALLRATAR